MISPGATAVGLLSRREDECGRLVGVERPATRLSGPTLDAANPLKLARFYARLLGWRIARIEEPGPDDPPHAGWALLRSPDGSQKIEIQWDSEYRPPVWPSVSDQQRMMMHLDIGVGDVESGVRWAVAQGARESDHQPQPGVRVMIDPEGHPFCLFPDRLLSTLSGPVTEAGD